VLVATLEVEDFALESEALFRERDTHLDGTYRSAALIEIEHGCLA
jgi:hypothetical protein